MIKTVYRVLERILKWKGIPIGLAKGLAKNFKLKKCFSTNLLSGNRLPKDVIDYQWPKLIYNSY